MARLQGQVAIVTGAGRGVGWAIAEALAAEGAAVALAARSEPELAEAARQLGRAVAVPTGFVQTKLVEDVARSPAGRRWLPELAERQDVLEPERAGRLVVELATGRADALSGRFLHVLDDLDDLVARADEIAREDLYALRLRRQD